MELSFMISEAAFIIYKSLGKYRKLQMQKLVKVNTLNEKKIKLFSFLFFFFFSKY